MKNEKSKGLENLGFVLALLMAILQAIYAVYAYVDPTAFALFRGTVLQVVGDADWVKIYASRTLFVAGIIGILLYFKNYKILAWTALLGLVMPITDALLAYQAQAADQVVIKHLVTAVYLLLTFFVLRNVVRNTEQKNH